MYHDAAFTIGRFCVAPSSVASLSLRRAALPLPLPPCPEPNSHTIGKTWHQQGAFARLSIFQSNILYLKIEKTPCICYGYLPLPHRLPSPPLPAPPWSHVSGSGSEFRVSGSEFRVSSSRFRVSCFVFRVSCSGFRVSGFGFRISCFVFGVHGLEFRIQVQG